MYLHIVSFDIPFPDNYGGVMVVFNEIKALHAQGVQVLLHCFQYGERQPQAELEKYCHEVHYYPRSRSPYYHLHWLPFIMRTRVKRALIRRLQRDEYPILFEGMHTSALVWDPRLHTRRKLVRMHNVEWQYYRNLSRLSPFTALFRKAYFFMESIKLQWAEPKVVAHADEIITISTHDEAYYRALQPDTHYIPAFHPNEAIEGRPGQGDYVLFHGKLSVSDNGQAATRLIEGVFSKLKVPFVVAGMDPPPALRELAGRYDHIRLVGNPDDRQMRSLITNAHINVLVSSQVAGIKLKLLNALFQGRFCIVNQAMVSGTRLAPLCHVCDSEAAIREAIAALMPIPFAQSQIEQRRAILETEFSNAANARRLMALINDY